MRPVLNTSESPRVSELDVHLLEDDDMFWDGLHSSRLFSIYHSRFWKTVIEETFGHEPVYIATSMNKHLVDVLPFFLIRNPILGKKLISTPYDACGGGFSNSNSFSRQKLIETVFEKAERWNVKYIEIRSCFSIPELKSAGFIEVRPFIISEVELSNIDDNWKRLSTKHRRNVRIAEKKGVIVEIAESWREMESLYDILFDHYRKLGLPFFGIKFFKKMWDELVKNDLALVMLARYKQKIIGGHLLFFSGDTLISKYSAVLKSNEYSKLYASYGLFWEAIKFGIERNLVRMNLGITGELNQGLLDFKSKFGANTKNVYFYYYLINSEMPDFRKYYHSYGLLKKLWSITPRFLAVHLGVKINEWIC